MSTFNDINWPIAAKSHRCEWCGNDIEKGEQHARFVGTWDGDFQNWRMHRECYASADDGDELAEGFQPYEHERPAAVVSPAQQGEP